MVGCFCTIAAAEAPPKWVIHVSGGGVLSPSYREADLRTTSGPASQLHHHHLASQEGYSEAEDNIRANCIIWHRSSGITIIKSMTLTPVGYQKNQTQEPAHSIVKELCKASFINNFFVLLIFIIVMSTYFFYRPTYK
jgi:hypothetical protein